MKPVRWIPFGRLTRPHGVRGELRFVPFNSGDSWPEGLTHLRIRFEDGSTRDVEVTARRPTRGAYLLRIAGVENRDQAEAVAQVLVAVSSRDLPPLEEGEFFLDELCGVRVMDPAGQILGKVRRIDGSSGQDLLSIQTDRGERLLPLVDETLERIQRDESGNLVALVVRVPEGLWE